MRFSGWIAAVRFGKRWLRGPLPVAAGALLLAVAGGCSKPAPAPTAPGKASGAKTEVVLVSPARNDFRYSLSRPGFIEAFEQTPVFAKLAGYAANVKADIGSEVKEGDLLAEVRIPEMSVELLQKEALVAKAKADLGSIQAKVK